MSTDEVSKWLSDGLAAATTGNRMLARERLQRVVDADENNVQGWLWLSGVVNTLEDREVCLANVLTLDPANEAAVGAALDSAVPEVAAAITANRVSGRMSKYPMISS